MDAAGRDDVFLETVGVGQAEVDIIDHADTVLLVLMPGGGDSVQALKAGIMEIPDIIVVNKADHPLTQTMVREIRGVLSLAPQGSWKVPILQTEAVDGARHRRAHGQARRAPRAHRAGGHAVRSAAATTCATRCSRSPPTACAATSRSASPQGDGFEQLIDDVVARRLDPASAAAAILDQDVS